MKKIIATLLVTGTTLGNLGGSVYAANTPTNYTSEVKAEITEGEEIIDPAPGPEEPEIPVTPNPDTNIYGIRYVSSLNFGSIDFSETEQTLSTEYDADLVGTEGGKLYSYALVRDIRAQEEREGWHLTVNQETEFIPGATLTFSPSFSDTSSGFTADDLIIPSTVTVTESPAEFMSTSSADSAAGAGALVTFGEAELVIPANTGVGQYSTNLIWNLVTGPSV